MDTGIVRDGWLLKSPPEKNFCRAVNLSSLRPKWHRRWFVLKHSGQLPGQFVLEYFTDSSCRKRKGQIDLDQCERVDSGLTFSNKKYNNRYMFDIRTPKRIYYLVAESEIDMIKWVDCICSVCGLKIEVEEDEEIRPNVEPVLSNTVQLTTSTAPASLVATPAASATNLTTVPSESSPYIPISECITGVPITNALKGSARSSDNLNLVVLPMRRSSADNRDLFTNDEFYDRPRPSCLAVVKNQSNTPELVRIPPAMHMHTKSEERGEWDNGFNDDDSLPLCPPKVNWNTFPHELMTDKPFDSPNYDVPTHSNQTPAPNFLVLDPTSKTAEFKVKGHKYVRCEKVKPKETVIVAQNLAGVNGPPPRPPKPAFLDKRKYENFDPDKAGDALRLYDIPPTTSSVSKESHVTKSLQGEFFSFKKEDSQSSKDLSPSAVVPLSATSPSNVPQRDNSLDDMYDFPRSRVDSKTTLPKKSALKAKTSRQHAYSNAPPGCFNAKENIMNYEYRPTLANDSSVDTIDSDASLEAESPLSPSSASGGMYANLITTPTDGLVRVPPQINRDLKPKKKGNENSDTGHGVFNLAPPPAPKMSSSKFTAGTAKQRAAPSPTPGSSLPPANIPSLPYRPSHSDHSDEELSSCGSNSRRDSANEEPGKHWVPPAARKVGGEIQYLELDMDSDNGMQIPRSPDRSSTSTVYKTVDFMKTKVFNEMRQNCEESYRKSQ